MQRGLSLIVLADWYNPAVMKTLRFFDENSQVRRLMRLIAPDCFFDVNSPQPLCVSAGLL
mgnify:CR=1 FL=1|jgi:hypothetical protein